MLQGHQDDCLDLPQAGHLAFYIRAGLAGNGVLVHRWRILAWTRQPPLAFLQDLPPHSSMILLVTAKLSSNSPNLPALSPPWPCLTPRENPGPGALT